MPIVGIDSIIIPGNGRACGLGGITFRSLAEETPHIVIDCEISIGYFDLTSMEEITVSPTDLLAFINLPSPLHRIRAVILLGR
jgi:hypothetical protein